MIRPGRASPLVGVVVYGGGGPGGVGGDVVLGDLSNEPMTDEDVVDQFLASSVDSAESLLGRDARGEVPKPLRVTFVGAVKPVVPITKRPGIETRIRATQMAGLPLTHSIICPPHV